MGMVDTVTVTDKGMVAGGLAVLGWRLLWLPA
jgi:hypothetical protein